MSVMSVVEKTMHRLESRERCLKMLKIYGKQHERYGNKNTNDKKKKYDKQQVSDIPNHFSNY